ncbi:MAG TPA: hypothetical protein VF461_14195 [Gemmatimonadaceae bacterium]
MTSPFLETTLLGACPELRQSWQEYKRTFAGGTAPDDQQLLDAVRRYVVQQLAAGRVVEFSRVARTIERLFGEADPVLYELLLDGLLLPLARDVRAAHIAPSLVLPHLGARTALAWPQ